MNRIGIFGGTFNPVHKAHVEIAKEFVKKFDLDMLYVIPNNIPPLKESHGVSGTDRLNMLNIAFSGQDKIKTSDIELKRSGTSFTCDTVAELKGIHNDAELFLLTGDDWIDGFERWKNYRFILDNVNLVIAYRGERDITASLDRLEAISGKRPFLLENERIFLSSSDFRSTGNSDMLPKEVYNYIKKRGIYGL